MMAEGKNTDYPRTYIVVGRTRASAFFGEKEELAITYQYGPNEQAEITFQTRYLDKGFDVLVPEDLWVEAHGKAVSLQSAAENLTNGARDLAAIISVSVNASIGRIDVELAYDATPGIHEREYFQSFLPEKYLSVVPGRKVNASATSALVSALSAHGDSDRLMRAVNQYSMALENWSMGSELLCVSHLFMGIEALKQVALREHLRVSLLTKDQLGKQWGYLEEGRESLEHFIDHQVRSRILFQNDADSHRKAKNVSDAIEHGITNFGELRPIAREVVVKTAKYLRAAILNLSQVKAESRDLLLASPFDTPRGPLNLVKYIWGKLSAETDKLAADGQRYPLLQWKSSLGKVSINEAEGYSFTPTETFTCSFAKGVNFNPERFEVWDGSILQEKPQPPIEPSSS